MAGRSPVLVVDDDLDSRLLLEFALSLKGYPVVSALNGAEALVLARRFHPEVILLDLAMPIMDGTAFRAEQLRDPELANIPVICVSGQYEAKQVADDLKCAGCIAKPFDIRDVVAHVARFIDISASPPAGGEGSM